MQGQDIVLDRHLVEENCEYTLLHLPGVLGTQNDHLLFGKVDGHGCSRRHTGRKSVRRERTSVVNDIVGVKMLQLLPRGADEHVSHEQRMIGSGADDAHVDPITFIPTCKAIDDVDPISGVEIIDCTLSVDAPDLSVPVGISVETDGHAPLQITRDKFRDFRMRGQRKARNKQPRCKGSLKPSALPVDICNATIEMPLSLSLSLSLLKKNVYTVEPGDGG